MMKQRPSTLPEQMYRLGYVAAAEGESRSWIETYGADALRGYDAFWTEVDREYEYRGFDEPRQSEG